MVPCKENFCGGNYQDWLEVNLIEKCNGKCSWCIEKNGYHPKEHASWSVLTDAILASGKQNICLLGGEPTLYPGIRYIIGRLNEHDKNVYVTTNGSMLTLDYIFNNLRGVTGVNISIHDNILACNEEVTGIALKNVDVIVEGLHAIGAKVRFNCNCIKGHIDSTDRMCEYAHWAKLMGADSIRFAELKMEDESFVNIAEMWKFKYGMTNDPFSNGCSKDGKLCDMPVNFRLMCGLQTCKRVRPNNPEQCAKKVLYYDGIMYDGWQTAVKVKPMTDEELRALLCAVRNKIITPDDCVRRIKEWEN